MQTFIFIAVFVMHYPADERLIVWHTQMTPIECEKQRGELQAEYDKGGRWAKTYRHFAIRCLPSA